MAIQYKPTKQKKEKPAKAPKAPKADKPMKMGSAVKVKTTQTSKAPKQPKAPKPEKVQSFAPFFKSGKVQKAENLEKKSLLKKSVNPKIAVLIVLALIVVAVIGVVLIVPAMRNHGEEIKEITVMQYPKKTIYLKGEEADYSGLRVKVTRNNGETFMVTDVDCELTGFNTDIAIENLNVVVQYKGFSTHFTIKVLEHEKPAPVLKSIYLDPLPKTEYELGEFLDVSGAILVREYMDGTSFRINLHPTQVFGWKQVNGVGTYTLTVKYAENGVLCTFDYEITVTE